MGEFSGWKKEQTIQQFYFNLKFDIYSLRERARKTKVAPQSSMISPSYLSFTRQHPFAAAMMYSGYSQVQEISPGGVWWKKSGTKSHEVIKVNRFVLVAPVFMYGLYKCHFSHINKISPSWKVLTLSISFIFVERNMCEFF